MADERINENVRYEHHGIDLRVLLWIAVGIVIVAVAIHTSVYALYKRSLKHGPETFLDVRSEFTSAPEPRLQTDPAADLAREKQTQQQRIDTYGWIDRPRGTVHVPIDRAMDLMIQKQGTPQK